MTDSRFSRMTALVADDTTSLRCVIRAMLEDLGFGRVLEARDGAEALRIVEREDGVIDLVVCDLDMPGIDGVDTVRGIAARQADCALIIASGFDRKLQQTVADLATGMGLRVLGTLVKPFEQAQLRAAVDRLGARPADRPRKKMRITPEELENALAADRIEVYYQPKVSLATGRVAGVEALARLAHPSLGMLLPETFIDVAESCGQILPLTLKVAEKSIAECARWARAGLNLTLAINLSALTLRKFDMPEVLSQLAQANGLANERIVLELTESQLGDAAELLHVVARFRIKRFGLSIDDFGTGQSGLQRLKGLPFTELKIDRSFVHGAATDPELRSIVETSISLGQRLGMETVAEGIETADDWNLVRELGCTYAQGFLAARPMSGAGLPNWSAGWGGIART